IRNASALGSTASGTIVNGKMLLILDGNLNVGAEPLTLAGELESFFGSSSWAGPVVLADGDPSGPSLETIGAGSQLTVRGPISGGSTQPLDVGGKGRVVLSGNNAYSSVTDVFGTVTIQSSSALGATTAGTVIGSGGILELDGGISVGAEPLTTSPSSGLTGPTLRSVNGTNEWDGPVTWGVPANGRPVNRVDVASGSELRLGGSVSGDGAWEKTGPGDLTLFAV